MTDDFMDYLRKPSPPPPEPEAGDPPAPIGWEQTYTFGPNPGAAEDEAEVPVEEPEPELEPISLDVWITHDTDNPHIREGFLKEDGSIEFFLPEGLTVTEIRGEKLNEAIQAGITEFKASKFLIVENDLPSQRTCKFFTPSKMQAADGAVEADNYEYDRPFKHCTCNNAQVLALSGQQAPVCMPNSEEALMTTCPYFEAEPHVVERAVHSTSANKTLQLLRTRRNYGFIEYSVCLITEGDTVTIPVLLGSSTIHTVNEGGPTRDELWETLLEAFVKDFGPETHDVTHKFQDDPPIKESYLNHVLAN